MGAHPGYPDRGNFGRVELGLSPLEIERLVAEQVAVVRQAAPPAFIKPHGALYHRCQSDPEAAAAVAKVARECGTGVVGQPGFALLEAARAAGLPAWREGYADRGYLPDGRLVPRGAAGDLLEPEAAADQALRLARSGEVDVICLHGDSPGAVDVARAVRERLEAAGVILKALDGSVADSRYDRDDARGGPEGS